MLQRARVVFFIPPVFRPRPLSTTSRRVYLHPATRTTRNDYARNPSRPRSPVYGFRSITTARRPAESLFAPAVCDTRRPCSGGETRHRVGPDTCWRDATTARSKAARRRDDRCVTTCAPAYNTRTPAADYPTVVRRRRVYIFFYWKTSSVSKGIRRVRARVRRDRILCYSVTVE